MKGNCLGIMQGRLTPPNGRGIQFFPFDNWEKEFELAKELGLDEIEFIFDYDRYEDNPLWSEEGISKIRKSVETHGIVVSAVCFDYFMRRPFFKKTGEERQLLLLENKKVLERVLQAMKKLHIKLIEIPLVDDSAMKTKEEKESVRAFLIEMFENRKDDIWCGLETDLPPLKFKKFLQTINVERVGANYDSGNSSGLGYEPYEEITTLSEYILNIHIKDRVCGGTTQKLGTGSADFVSLARALEQIKYNGSFILQAARGKDGDEMNNIKEQIAFLQKYFV